jgi:beta-N-acetylhexosaminidase
VRNQQPLASIRAWAGQLLIIGFEGTDVSPRLASLLQRLQPAGVIVFGRNVVSAQQTHGLLKACQKLVPTPLFRCVDMEGGSVDRLKKVLEPAPSAGEVFATGDRKLFRKHGRVIGEECCVLGFNTDFAPVSDLAFEASRSVMGSRAVSASPRQTVLYVREFLRGLAQAGVLGCGKHFPGLGEGTLDSHQYLPVIHKPWKQLWGQDLYPYRVLRRNYPFVMVSHAAYPAVTGDQVPASLSPKWIGDVLRKKIRYRGLVVSDDLEMGGILTAAPVEEAAVRHIRAGGDLCLVCHKEESVEQAYEALLKEAERDGRFAERVRESATRILNFKRKAKEMKRTMPPPTPAKIERLTRQLWEFSEQVRLESLARREPS